MGEEGVDLGEREVGGLGCVCKGLGSGREIVGGGSAGGAELADVLAGGLGKEGVLLAGFAEFLGGEGGGLGEGVEIFDEGGVAVGLGEFHAGAEEGFGADALLADEGAVVAKNERAVAVFVEGFGWARGKGDCWVWGDVEGAGSEEAGLVDAEFGVGGDGEGGFCDADEELDAVCFWGDGADLADLAAAIADGRAFADSGDVGKSCDDVEGGLAEGAAF